MRLSYPPECPLCGETSSDEAFFPAHVDGLSIDAVKRLFHPVGIHWNCYLAWPGRAKFAQDLFIRQTNEIGGLYGRSYLNDNVAVFVSIYEPRKLEIVLAETGRMLRLSAIDWEQWRKYPEKIAPHCHTVERLALQQALTLAWEKYPDIATLLAQTDWSGSEQHLYEWPKRTSSDQTKPE